MMKFYILTIFFFVFAILTFFNVPNVPLIPVGDIFTMLEIAVGISFLVTAELKREQLGEYYITNYRIVVTRGILGSHTDSVSYTGIVNIKIKQSFFERLVGLGDIEILTARGRQEIDLFGVKNPGKIENLIYRLLEKHAFIEKGKLEGVEPVKKQKPLWKKVAEKAKQQGQKVTKGGEKKAQRQKK